MSAKLKVASAICAVVSLPVILRPVLVLAAKPCSGLNTCIVVAPLDCPLLKKSNPDVIPTLSAGSVIVNVLVPVFTPVTGYSVPTKVALPVNSTLSPITIPETFAVSVTVLEASTAAVTVLPVDHVFDGSVTLNVLATLFAEIGKSLLWYHVVLDGACEAVPITPIWLAPSVHT